MAQSSIEWLIAEFKTLSMLHIKGKIDDVQVSKRKFEILDQAKAMHRQEIIDSISAGWDYNERGMVRWMGEQYYQETFGKKTFLDLVSDKVSPVHEVIKKAKAKKALGVIQIIKECSTHKREEMSYLVWQANAKERLKKGDKQTQCKVCGRWYFEDEF